MGHTVCGRHNRRTCDACGACPSCHGGAALRRFACPFRWCGPEHLCPACALKYRDALRVEGHRKAGCERNAVRLAADRAKTAALLAGGFAVRRSALAMEGGKVHVLFEVAGGRTVGYTMSGATYDTMPLATPATPEDYRAHGELTEAGPTFAGGAVSKEVGGP